VLAAKDKQKLNIELSRMKNASDSMKEPEQLLVHIQETMAQHDQSAKELKAQVQANKKKMQLIDEKSKENLKIISQLMTS